MGTNYWWLPPHPLIAPLHIGKSSAGWYFALHVYPDGIPNFDEEELKLYPARDFDDWKELFAVKNSLIRDGYGELRTVEHMIKVITCRAWTSRVGTHNEQWFHENGAIAGQFGLSRRIIGKCCVAHGEGTWDCCVGDFS